MQGRLPDKTTKTIGLQFSDEEKRPVYDATIVITQSSVKTWSFTSFAVSESDERGETAIGKTLPVGELVFDAEYHAKGIRGYKLPVSGTQLDVL